MLDRANVVIVAGVLLLIGLINAWVLNAGFNMLRYKSFSSSSSSSSDAPVVAVLSGNRFIIVDDNKAQIFRIASDGKAIAESISEKDTYSGYVYRSFGPLPTPVPTRTPYPTYTPTATP